MKLRLKGTVLLIILVSAVAGRLQVAASDSAFKPIKLTGWNADVVFENARFPAAASFDALGQQESGYPGYAWFEAGLEGHADGLPASRRFTSAVDTNVVFELQPYNTNNVLLLTMLTPSGTLVLAEPAAYRSLFVLAAAGGGDNAGTLQLHFSDGTDSRLVPFRAPDWWASYPSTGLARTPALTGLGRSYGKQFRYQDWHKNQGDAGFALYQTEIDLTALILHPLAIQSVTFKMGSGSLTVGIFAISGERSKSSDWPTVELERK